MDTSRVGMRQHVRDALDMALAATVVAATAEGAERRGRAITRAEIIKFLTARGTTAEGNGPPTFAGILGRIDHGRQPGHDRNLAIAKSHRDPALGVVVDDLERDPLLESHLDQTTLHVLLAPADAGHAAALAFVHEVERELDGHNSS